MHTKTCLHESSVLYLYVRNAAYQLYKDEHRGFSTGEKSPLMNTNIFSRQSMFVKLALNKVCGIRSSRRNNSVSRDLISSSCVPLWRSINERQIVFRGVSSSRIPKNGTAIERERKRGGWSEIKLSSRFYLTRFILYHVIRTVIYCMMRRRRSFVKQLENIYERLGTLPRIHSHGLWICWQKVLP